MPHREGTGPLTQRSWCMRTSCGAPSTWRPARRRSRSWPPERWRSSDSPSDRPETEPSSPAMSPSRRTRGAESAHNTGGGARNFTRSWAGTVAPPRNPAVAAPWPYRAAFLGPPLCHCPSRPRKTPCRGSGERNGRAHPPYLTATPSRGPGERVGTPEVAHEVIRTRIRPRAAVDFRRGVWEEKTPPEPSVLAHAGWPMSGYCYPITKRPKRPSTPGACQRSPFSNRLGQYRNPPGAPGRARQ